MQRFQTTRHRQVRALRYTPRSHIAILKCPHISAQQKSQKDQLRPAWIPTLQSPVIRLKGLRCSLSVLTNARGLEQKETN